MRRKGRCVLWGARRRDLLLGARTWWELCEQGMPPSARMHAPDGQHDRYWLWMLWR